MKKFILSQILALVLLSFVNLYSQSPEIIQLINKVNKDSLTLYLRQLSGDTSCVIGGAPYTIVSRHKNQPGNDKAGQYIYEKFQSWGYQVQYESFSSTGKNVIATKPGLFDSQKYFIVCAHYDDMPSGTTAPGADDNASGTATVLELARVFAQHNFNYTIKFMCFDEEEQGLVGSNYYATQARNRNDSIIGVINLDMTAYDANNDGMVDVHSNSVANTAQIANEWINNISQYGIALTPRTVASQPYSDHYSFQQKNYGAILVIEYDLEFNPRYHTVNDKIQYLNMNYAHKIAQVTAATAAEYIQIVNSNTATFLTNSGWNLISIPINPADGRKSVLFPTAISYAYAYDGSYVMRDTLQVGRGYWLKFNSSQNHSISGQTITNLQIPLKQGWNLIGTLNGVIPVNSITTNPPNIIASLFFEYNGGYSQAQQLEKGKGYWVKSSQNGILNLSLTGKSIASSNSQLVNSKYILLFETDNATQKLYLTEEVLNKEFYEMPPEPPTGVFDVRFADNYLVNNLFTDECLIKISSNGKPINVNLLSSNESEQIQLNYYSNGNSYKIVVSNNQKFALPSDVSYIKVKKLSQPKEFVLSQNYPNPFNPKTTINFKLPEDAKVTLKVYDIHGRIVETLIDENKNAGNHSINFDGSKYSSGIYFYELSAGKYKAIKKMMLVK
ncbi:MAG: M20/M25/M40 family metallo-hydrolase [Ignavibacteria bacterium]|nr:M20/M25/M40 family metallo-hydrolase [Ignavibacteria bacterium]